jgi:hypothetical protein
MQLTKEIRFGIFLVLLSILITLYCGTFLNPDLFRASKTEYREINYSCDYLQSLDKDTELPTISYKYLYKQQKWDDVNVTIVSVRKPIKEIQCN